MRPLCLPHSVVCGVPSPCALPAALQAFCRVAAVAGAVQVLRCPVEGPLFDEHTFSCIGVELGSGQVRVGGLDGVVFLQRGGAGQRAGEGRGGEVWGDASIHVWWLEVVSPEPWLLPTQLIPMPQHSLSTPRPRFIHSPHPTPAAGHPLPAAGGRGGVPAGVAGHLPPWHLPLCHPPLRRNTGQAACAGGASVPAGGAAGRAARRCACCARRGAQRRHAGVPGGQVRRASVGSRESMSDPCCLSFAQVYVAPLTPAALLLRPRPCCTSEPCCAVSAPRFVPHLLAPAALLLFAHPCCSILARRFVLHLWTPAPPGGSRSALDTLRPALESLVDVSGLLPLDKAQQAQRAEGAPPHPGAAPEAPAAAAAAVGAGPPGSEGVEGKGEAAGARQEGSTPEPRALLAAFFTQQRVAIGEYPGAWPANTVLCPGPDHTASFRSAVADARACFSRWDLGVKWRWEQGLRASVRRVLI